MQSNSRKSAKRFSVRSCGKETGQLQEKCEAVFLEWPKTSDGASPAFDFRVGLYLGKMRQEERP